MQNGEFKRLLQIKGDELFRDMPWRRDTRPYYVLISEMMLQQTQVARVIPKFNEFIQRFPNETALADAPLADVLRIWQGLGYNRRAKFLHDAAKKIMTDFGGVFPEKSVDILSLPGVGKHTAGAIEAYAFNRPALFIETNIRTVYIHHFFADAEKVTDTEILKKLESTLWKTNPRKFYWSLMDYGSWLKGHGIKNTSRSKHYQKQAPLKGSVREVRGQILRELSSTPTTGNDLKHKLNADDRFEPALNGLLADGLIEKHHDTLRLTN